MKFDLKLVDRNHLIWFMVIILSFVIFWLVLVSKNAVFWNISKTEELQEMENKYLIEIKDKNKNLKNLIPMKEKDLIDDKIKQKCLSSQIERIFAWEKYEIGFCDKSENLKQFADPLEQLVDMGLN